MRNTTNDTADLGKREADTRRILVITACTGKKAVRHENALTLQDFKRGPEHIAAREQLLKGLMLPAEEMYTGQQHMRLMRGVRGAREAGADVELHILSAGYGLIRGDHPVAPYEVTFQGMKKRDLHSWGDALGAPAALREVLARCFDLGLLLLGESYLEACRLDANMTLGGPTIVFCGSRAAKRVPHGKSLCIVPLGNREARRFSCGLVGLKGQLAHRVLERVGPKNGLGPLLDPTADLLTLLDGDERKPKTSRAARANPAVDSVIQIPKPWWHKPHRKQLRYFIPEWDDLVDPDYDFETDTHSGGSGDWSNEVYAHQLYPEPNYDGILISRAVAEKSKKKNARINALGVHRYLRVPRDFPIMGDCGAFDYIQEKEPPYTTQEVIDYYTRLDFDAGVSVDHLIVPAVYDEKEFRYELTTENAREFLDEHRRNGLQWEPIGAVQGWDAASYADAVTEYVRMGYGSVALGGLVRSPTKQIVQILHEVRSRLKPGVKLHLFGIARPEALPTFASLGVTSVDSASHLRRAWLIARDNYFTLEGTSYSAIRIPEVGKSYRTKRIIRSGKATERELCDLQRAAMDAVISVDIGQAAVPEAVSVIEAYDRLIGEDREWIREEYRRTLTDQPWKNCPCDICRKWGVQVVIFRGNNRNRRRGFHNTYVFYRLMQRALQENGVPTSGLDQLPLFRASEAG